MSAMGGKRTFIAYAYPMVRPAALLMFALLWPPLVGFAYLSLSPEHLQRIVGYGALAVTVLPGAIAFWTLWQFHWVWKAAITVPYILLMSGLLFALAFGTTCARFGGCL